MFRSRSQADSTAKTTWQPARALVTGASDGLGASLAKRLAARGIETWLAARRAPELQARVDDIRASGGRAHVLVLDVGDVDAAFARLQQLDEETGGIDLVVANAGVAGARSSVVASRTPWHDFRDILQVNLTGAAATLMPFVPRMLERGRGQLVGISSMAAEFPNARVAAYGASKAGLSFMLKCMDQELRPQGVPVTIVEPGFVRTPASSTMTEKLPFMLELDAAVTLIEKGIQRQESMVRFPWELRTLLLGLRALPRPIVSAIVAHRAAAGRKH